MIKFIKNNQILNIIVKYIAYLYIKLLFLTYKLKIEPQTNKPINQIFEKGIFYFWHQNIISVAFFFFKKKIVGHCIISPSKDGKIIGFIAQKLGFKVVYGSAYKNTITLVRKTLDILDLNKKIAIVGDGSRGPAKKLQRGVIYFASKSKLPLIFIDCHPSIAIKFNNSWDKFKIPLPFSKIYVKVQTPTYSSIDAYKNF
jgi:lysophospholipid acyltransferase (LPLAT)-like uncharacterized protein